MSSTTEDKDIYQLATEKGRIVVTIDEDFKKLAKPKKAGVVFIPPYLSTSEMDNLLVKFIRGKNPDDYIGKAIKINSV